jgi:hypothetical protein
MVTHKAPLGPREVRTNTVRQEIPSELIGRGSVYALDA